LALSLARRQSSFLIKRQENSKANFGSASTKTKIVNPNAIALEGVNKAKVNLAAAEESVQKAKDALTVAQKFQKDFIPPPPPAGITPKKTDPSKKPTTTPGPAVTDNTKKLIITLILLIRRK
jgi:hypothetical protein